MKKRRIRRNPESGRAMIKRLAPWFLFSFAATIAAVWLHKKYIARPPQPAIPPTPQPQPFAAPAGRTVINDSFDPFIPTILTPPIVQQYEPMGNDVIDYDIEIAPNQYPNPDYLIP